MHSVPIYFEARSRIAPGTGVHCVRQRSYVDLVERVPALKAGDNTSVTWLRDVTVSVERDESTKSSNATYGTLMMLRPVPTEALKAAEDAAATRSSTTRPVADVVPRMR